jgi:DNA primase
VTRYTDESRERVREAIDMVALVSTRTELRRAGVNSYFGICPFHEERTGSLHVSPDERLYHCFGCQASGDAFKFVMETEGLDFTSALEALAQRFGVEIQAEAEDPQAASRRERWERLSTLLERAAAYYARYLWEANEAAPAREYLLGRGLREETLREFAVGYAPSAWDRMLLASRRAGFSDEELLAVGLAQRSQSRPGQIYDRFRERIMFPSANARGRVVGFGARAMRDNQRPKYLNTADNDLYHKRQQLFGINLARSPAARAGRMVLVEGYTDVLALHQAGLGNAVGIMGTSLTEEQVRELERVVSVLELCLDADRAGQDAMLRAARLAAGRKLELRVVPLPEGTDPADLIAQEGADALRELVDRSTPFIVFEVQRILDRADISSAEGRDRALAELRPVLAELPASVLREDLLRRIAGRLELSPARLATLVADSAAGRGGVAERSAPGANGSAPPVDQGVRSERTFLVLCISLPVEGEEMLSSIDPDQLLTSEPYRRAARHLTGRLASPLAELPPHDEQLASLVADLVARSGRAGAVTADQLEHARLVLELARVERAIRRGRTPGSAGIADLARERERIRQSIRATVARMERAV